MKVSFNVLDRQYLKYKDEYLVKVAEILERGHYVLGNEVRLFEEEYAQYVGAQYCVGVASGLDALILSMRALDIKNGDEVIVQGNAYIASIMGITMNGATPVLVEPDNCYNIDVEKIEEKITEKTKAILVVHLYGQMANVLKIREICDRYELYMIEDCAQAHGSKRCEIRAGELADMACWSFYPSKNLGAFGDGGAVTLNNEEMSKAIKTLRNYGSDKRYHNKVVGYNSRLDELQAGLLRVKLSHLEELLDERKYIARCYLDGIENKYVELPCMIHQSNPVWHLFVVQVESSRRMQFIEYLEQNGIQSLIHYPVPPHLSEAYSYLGYKAGDFPITERLSQRVISLPIYIGMTETEIKYVIDTVNGYAGE